MTARSTTIRDRDRRAIARHKPPCGIYLLHDDGDAATIDYSLPHTDPMSYVVDHVIPLAQGGEDVIGNKQAAHRICNRAKSDKLADELGPRTFVTHRVW